MKVKDLATLLTASATFLGAAGMFVKQLAEIRKDQADTYQNAALTFGDHANELEELRARIKQLEEKKQ